MKRVQYRLVIEALPPAAGERPVLVRIRWGLKRMLRDLRLRCKSIEEIPCPGVEGARVNPGGER
jgi:hypothetical protein